LQLDVLRDLVEEKRGGLPLCVEKGNYEKEIELRARELRDQRICRGKGAGNGIDEVEV